MLAPVYTKQFEKDVKRSGRRGKNLEKFKIIARDLLSGKVLDPIQRDQTTNSSVATLVAGSVTLRQIGC